MHYYPILRLFIKEAEGVLRKIIISIVWFLSANVLSHDEFIIDEFSDKYRAKIILDKQTPGEVLLKGKVEVWTKKTDERVLTVNSDELTINDLNKKNTNNKIAYAHQNLIIYEDFNFDGIKDFALQDGYQSCYHGPSYNIFLNRGTFFQLNKEFTKMTHGPYCGMFEIDSSKKTITTSNKSGCCLHITTTHQVLNNVPKPLLEIEEKYFPESNSKIITTKKWEHGERIISKQKIILE